MKKDVDRKITAPELLQFFFMTAILFVFWLLLSGIFTPKMMLIGLATSAIVAWITRPLVRIPSIKNSTGVYLIFRFPLHKFLLYCLWLFVEIIKASIYVMKLVLHPKMPIDPMVVTFKSNYDNPLSVATLGNSITLTPGTITLAVEDGTFYVHALTKEAGLGAAPADGKDSDMAGRIGKLFEKQPDRKASKP